MRKTRLELQTIEAEVVEDVLCNKCGKSCMCLAGMNYEGLIEVTSHFGYGSLKFGDMTKIQFSLCENCLWEIIQTFKHPADVTEYECVLPF